MFRFRPRLRISIRTMLVLVTVVCFPLGWLGYQMNWIRQRREAVARIGVRGYVWKDPDELFVRQLSPQAPWVLKLLGETGVAAIEMDRFSDADRAELRALFPEAEFIVTPEYFDWELIPSCT